MALVLACSCSWVTRARAEPDADQDAPVEDEPIEVVVTGKRAGEDRFEADRSISRLSQEELAEQAPRNTPEALWDTPGVFVQQTNHGGGSPIVRGMIGPQVLLLFDGVRLNNSVYRTGPLQYLNLIDPLSLSRLEVLRGPGSVLYGSDAMGGVIQALPLRVPDNRTMLEEEVSGATLVRYASANHGLGAHSHVQIGAGGFGALAGGTMQSFDDLVTGRGGPVEPYSGYGHRSAIGSVAYRFPSGLLSGWSAKATYLFSRIDNAGRTDNLRTKQSVQFYDNDLHLAFTRFHLELPSLRTGVDVTPSYQGFFERKDTIAVASDLSSPLGVERDEVAAHTFGLDIKLDTELVGDRLGLVYGGMFYRDWVSASRAARTGDRGFEPIAQQDYPSGSTYDQRAGFIMLEAEPIRASGGHVVRLRGGYRLTSMAGHAPARSALPEVDFSHLGNVLMSAVQYLYRDRATVALSFAQGFRAPNLQEAVMLGDAGSFFHTPNDQLGPETSDTFELLGRARLWRLTLSWSSYLSLITERLERVDTTFQGQTEIGGKPVVQHVNGQSATVHGGEGRLGIDLGRGFSLTGTMSYIIGQEHHSDGRTVPLSRIPPPFGTTTLRYANTVAPRWSGFVEAFVRWALAQRRLSPNDERDVRIPEGGTPGWSTWNLRAGLSGHHHRFVGSVENLLDSLYKYHGSGLYAPGTNATVSYEFSF